MWFLPDRDAESHASRLAWTPDDIAKVDVFLASEDSARVTGEAIRSPEAFTNPYMESMRKCGSHHVEMGGDLSYRDVGRFEQSAGGLDLFGLEWAGLRQGRGRGRL